MNRCWRPVAAEFVRVRRTASSRLWLFGLALCVIQGAGSLLVGTIAVTQWRHVLVWQALFVTGLNTPLVGLLVGLTFQRERLSRGGGTSWRGTGRSATLLARFLVLALQMLALDVAVTVPMLPVGWARGLTETPWAMMLALPAALFAATLGFLALAMVLAERFGLFAAVALGLVWQIVGTVFAESPSWPMQPWTWSVRPVLPILGIHPNGVPADPGSAVTQIAVWPPVLASLALAPVALAAAVWLPTSLPYRRRAAGVVAVRGDVVAGVATGSVPRGAAHPVAATALSLRRTAIGWLLLATALALASSVAVWRDPAYVQGLVAFLIIPIGSCLLACVVATVQRPVLRSLLTRAASARLCASTAVVCLGVLTGVVTLSTVALIAAGATDVLRTAALGWLVGAAGIAVNLWLSMRWSVSIALGVSLLSWLVGVVVGGSTLANSALWLLGPSGWTLSADTLPRALIATFGCLATTMLFWRLWVRATRRAAVQET